MITKKGAITSVDQRCSNCGRLGLSRVFAIFGVEAVCYIALAATVGILLRGRGYNQVVVGVVAAVLVLVVSGVLRRTVWPWWRGRFWICGDCHSLPPDWEMVDGVQTMVSAWQHEGKWCASVYRLGWRGSYQADMGESTRESAVSRAVLFALQTEERRTPESDAAELALQRQRLVEMNPPSDADGWWTCGVCGRRSAFVVNRDRHKPSFWYVMGGVLHCKDCGWKQTDKYKKTGSPPRDGWYPVADGPVIEYPQQVSQYHREG